MNAGELMTFLRTVPHTTRVHVAGTESFEVHRDADGVHIALTKVEPKRIAPAPPVKSKHAIEGDDK